MRVTVEIKDSEESEYRELPSLPTTQTPLAPGIDWSLIKIMYIQILLRMAMFDGSMRLVEMPTSMGEMADDNGDSTNYKAAAALAINTLNVAMVVGVYPLLSFIQVGAGIMQEMATNQAAAQRKYARLPRNLALISILPVSAATAILYFGDDFWRWTGKEPDVTRLAGQFLKPCAVLPVIFFGRFMSDLELLFQGKGNFVMWVTLASMAFGIGVSEVLGFGWLSAPELDMEGTAIGFITQMALSWVILNGYILFSPLFQDYPFRRHLLRWTGDDSEQMKALIPLALTYLFTILSEIGAQAVTTGLPEDSDQVAALNYVAIISLAAFLWSHAVGQISQQLIKAEYMAKNFAKVRQLIKYSLAISLTPAPLYVLIGYFANLLYNASPEVENYADTLIPYEFIIALLYAPTFVNLENLKATDSYIKPVAKSMAGLWLGVGVSYYLEKSQGVTGVIRGNLVGVGTALLLSLHSVKKEFWDKPAEAVIADHKEQPAPAVPARAVESKATSFISAKPSTPSSSGSAESSSSAGPSPSTSRAVSPLLRREASPPEPASSAWCGCFSRLYRRCFGSEQVSSVPTTSIN